MREWEELTLFWGLQWLARRSKHGFHARGWTAKDEAGGRRGKKGKRRAFSRWISWVSPPVLSKSIVRSGDSVIKDFSKSGILEIGIQTLLSMVTSEVELHPDLLHSEGRLWGIQQVRMFVTVLFQRENIMFVPFEHFLPFCHVTTSDFQSILKGFYVIRRQKVEYLRWKEKDEWLQFFLIN